MQVLSHFLSLINVNFIFEHIAPILSIFTLLFDIKYSIENDVAFCVTDDRTNHMYIYLTTVGNDSVVKSIIAAQPAATPTLDVKAKPFIS